MRDNLKRAEEWSIWAKLGLIPFGAILTGVSLIAFGAHQLCDLWDIRPSADSARP